MVALSPALTVTMRDLGIGGVLVGRHAWDATEPGLPACGDQNGLDYERILGLEPTHVLLQWGAREVPSRLSELAAERGWVVENFPLLALADVRAMTARLGTVFGAAARAGELEAEMARAFSVREGEARFGGRVLLLGSSAPVAALGPGSWHHQLLEAVGGRPALTEGKPYISMDAEDVRGLAPEGIVLIDPRPMGEQRSAGAVTGAAVMERLGRLATLTIPAVQSGRVALIDDPLALTPSTAMIAIADQIAGVLAGWGG